MESRCRRQRLYRSVLTGRYLISGKPDILADRKKEGADNKLKNVANPKKNVDRVAAGHRTEFENLDEYYDDLDENEDEFNQMLRKSMVVLEGCDVATRSASYRMSTENILQDYDFENLPHLVPKRCGPCKACEKCRQDLELKSHDDYLLEKQMRSNLKYNPEKKQFIATIEHDPVIEELGDNFENAKRALHAMQRKIMKDKDGKKKLAQLDTVFFQGVQQGTFLPIEEATKTRPTLTKEKKHFLVFSYVNNPSSESTPLRLVCDSSRPHRKGEASYNETTLKGHHSINKIL